MLNLHYLLRYLLSRLQLGTERTLQKCHVKKLDQQRYDVAVMIHHLDIIFRKNDYAVTF